MCFQLEATWRVDVHDFNETGRNPVFCRHPSCGQKVHVTENIIIMKIVQQNLVMRRLSLFGAFSSSFALLQMKECFVSDIFQAYETYELGTKKGLFRSLYQRSLYNVDHLTPRAWWTPEETGNEEMLKVLQQTAFGVLLVTHWPVSRKTQKEQIKICGVTFCKVFHT